MKKTMRKAIMVALLLCTFLLTGCQENVQDAMESSIDNDAEGGIGYVQNRLDDIQNDLDEKGSEMENLDNAIGQ